MKVINQTKENTCLVCVLAMIVNESEQYVLDWFEYIDPPISDEDAFIFLAHHGRYLATGAVLKDKKTQKGIGLSDTDCIEIRWDMGNEAYLVVDSHTKENRTHAVFWTGKKILDPMEKKPQPLSKYKVRYLYPMQHNEKHNP